MKNAFYYIVSKKLTTSIHSPQKRSVFKPWVFKLLSENWTFLSGYWTLWTIFTPRLPRLGEFVFENWTLNNPVFWHLLDIEIYSQRPKTERLVWQTELFFVRFKIIRLVPIFWKQNKTGLEPVFTTKRLKSERTEQTNVRFSKTELHILQPNKNVRRSDFGRLL